MQSGAESVSRERVGHRGVQGCSRKLVRGQKGSGGMTEGQGQGKQEMRGERVGHRDMQGQQGWCHGGAQTHQGLLLGEPSLGCDEAQRGGVRMLVHLAEVVLQDLQLLLSGSHWLLCGHLLLGQGYGARHCGEGPASLPKLGVASGATLAEPQVCHPHPHQLPLPSGFWLQQGTTPFPKACWGAQPGAPASQKLLPQFPHCGDRTPTAPS